MNPQDLFYVIAAVFLSILAVGQILTLAVFYRLYKRINNLVHEASSFVAVTTRNANDMQSRIIQGIVNVFQFLRSRKRR